MGWQIGYDDKWKRDIGYGVPAFCDEPGCGEVIDRGLGYVCRGNEVCGLFFCGEHGGAECTHENYTATPEHPDWIRHKETDPSWAEWRTERDATAARPGDSR